MKKLIIIFLLLLISGCAGKWDKDGCQWSFFTGSISAVVDPQTGGGTWTRLGDYKASGISIMKDGTDYIIEFDQSESRTEFDKMKFFFEAGVEAGKKVVLP